MSSKRQRRRHHVADPGGFELQAAAGPSTAPTPLAPAHVVQAADEDDPEQGSVPRLSQSQRAKQVLAHLQALASASLKQLKAAAARPEGVQVQVQNNKGAVVQSFTIQGVSKKTSNMAKAVVAKAKAGMTPQRVVVGGAALVVFALFEVGYYLKEKKEKGH